jgi:hypothetical protein
MMHLLIGIVDFQENQRKKAAAVNAVALRPASMIQTLRRKAAVQLAARRRYVAASEKPEAAQATLIARAAMANSPISGNFP